MNTGGIAINLKTQLVSPPMLLVGDSEHHDPTTCQVDHVILPAFLILTEEAFGNSNWSWHPLSVVRVRNNGRLQTGAPI